MKAIVQRSLRKNSHLSSRGTKPGQKLLFSRRRRLIGSTDCPPWTLLFRSRSILISDLHFARVKLNHTAPIVSRPSTEPSFCHLYCRCSCLTDDKVRRRHSVNRLGQINRLIWRLLWIIRFENCLLKRSINRGAGGIVLFWKGFLFLFLNTA